MRITFTPSGSGTPIALTGDAPDEGAMDLDGSAASTPQVEALFRAEQIEIFDRSNVQSTFAFAVERTHATPGAAMWYWLEHLRAVRGKGLVTFRATEETGALVGERTLATAFIVSSAGRPDGCATRFTYQIIGGKLT